MTFWGVCRETNYSFYRNRIFLPTFCNSHLPGQLYPVSVMATLRSIVEAGYLSRSAVPFVHAHFVKLFSAHLGLSTDDLCTLIPSTSTLSGCNGWLAQLGELDLQVDRQTLAIDIPEVGTVTVMCD